MIKKMIKITEKWLEGTDFDVKVSPKDFYKGSQMVKEGDRIAVDNGIEKVEGVFIRQTGTSYAGSYGEYKTLDGKIHIYDEFVHTIRKVG